MRPCPDASRLRQGLRWAPDGTSLLLSAQFNIRTTVWSLRDRRCHYLPGAKSASSGIAFSPDGLLMAQLEVGATWG